jgi:hypothetical protein
LGDVVVRLGVGLGVALGVGGGLVRDVDGAGAELAER